MMGKFKTQIKKLTSAALTALLVVTSVQGLAGGVAAKTYRDLPSDMPYREQVDILSDIGVIVGTGEDTFSPDSPVTREQMAMLLFRLMLGRNNAGNVNTTSFVDLYDETYNGAISWANASGYIIGTSDNTFEPTGGITMQDAMTMVVRALGQSNANMNRGYPWTYIDAAVRLGLDRGLESAGYESVMTRAQTAALLYNALTAECLLTRVSNTGVSTVLATTIIENVFGYELTDGLICADNSYALPGYEPVIKEHYVTLATRDGSMTVDFQTLGLSGSSSEWLGRSVKVICKRGASSKITVLGASCTGRTETFHEAVFKDNGRTVMIGDVLYNVVEKRSDSLSTNLNELLVYAYDEDGQLAQLPNNAALKNALGIYDLTLIYDTADAEIADRAILKPYRFGMLAVNDGRLNLADDRKESELSAFVNDVGAKSGDYVLYYFNKTAGCLEIKEVLIPETDLLVTRQNGMNLVAGGKTYTAGCAAAGVVGDAILSQLAVGRTADLVSYDGMILAVVQKAIPAVEAQYLLVTEDAVPVYHNGALRTVTSAIIDGKKTSVMLTNASVNSGSLYRYTVDASGIYTLIPTDNASFTSSTDFAETGTTEEAVTLRRNSGAYYTLNGTHFITDENTRILLHTGSGYAFKKGAYAAELMLDAGADFVAVYRNNIGNVETLRFLYVDGGSFGTVDDGAQIVKILAKSGTEYRDGAVWQVYEVLNHMTGKRETRLSRSDDLMIGSSYALDIGEHISTACSDAPVTGLVNGCTASTLTVGSSIYKITSETKFVRIGAGLALTEMKPEQVNGRLVEFLVTGGEVRTVLVLGPLSFDASYDAEARAVVLTPSVDIRAIPTSEIRLQAVFRDADAVNLSGWEIVREENVLRIPLYWIDAGSYTLSIGVSGLSFIAALDLPEILPAQ